MANKDDYQPVYIMPEGTQRNSGKSAQRLNILAAKLVAEAVRTTLGPKGMDKMLVDSLGEVIVTNDGVTILKEMSIDHPSAKMIIEVAKTQEEEVGDGTTTAVIIAGELLAKAEYLLDNNVHPTIISKGYRLAAVKAQEILEKLAIPLKPGDNVMLAKIAETAMTGKGAEDSKSHLSGLLVDAVEILKPFNKENIKIEKKTGSGVEESELIKGVVIDKEKVHPDMASEIKNARIALIDSEIEIKTPETSSKISISDPAMLQSFLDMEENMLKKMVDKIKNTGANVVFCQKGIDDLAQHFLAKNNIYAVRRVKKSDMARLSKATSAKIISDLNDFTSKDLGSAGLIEHVKVGEDYMTYVRDCKNTQVLTFLIRGTTPHVVDEAARAVEDAIGDMHSALKTEKIVSGAGSVEIELSKELKKYAHTLSGKEQLAVISFSEALEVIPKTLAENAGLDPIDVLAELKAAHDASEKNVGINVFQGGVFDALKNGIVEPLKIKTQAVSSAAEVAIMILRIDDIILSSQKPLNNNSDQGIN